MKRYIAAGVLIAIVAGYATFHATGFASTGAASAGGWAARARIAFAYIGSPRSTMALAASSMMQKKL
jgi:hypothetical protein